MADVLWFWEEGHAESETQVSQRDAEAWTDDLDWMLRLTARRRQFDWAAVAIDMAQYVACIATSGVVDSATPAVDVSVVGLRKRWAYMDSSACHFYRRKLLRRPPPLAPAPRPPPPLPPSAAQPPAARALEAVNQRAPSDRLDRRSLDVTERAAPRLERASVRDAASAAGAGGLDALFNQIDLDGLLQQLEEEAASTARSGHLDARDGA
jgi:hypothetical protein